MIYNVHNLKEGSRAGNYLSYWENATGIKANKCHKVDCSKPATDGAHVQLDDPSDNNWYIVSLCHECNYQFGEHFAVRGPLVSEINSKIILW